jgi:methanogenic corrinoid protein MtbC1
MSAGSITSRTSATQGLIDLVSREILPQMTRLARPAAFDTRHPGTPTDAPSTEGLRIDPSLTGQLRRAPAPTLTEQVCTLSELAIRDRRGDCLALLEREHAEGRSVESILIDLMQTSARHLGVQWEEDRVSFYNVTAAVWTLRSVMADFLSRLESGADNALARHPDIAQVVHPAAPAAPSALFCTLPGNAHRFGIQLLAGYFRQAGWSADIVEASDEVDLMTRLQRSRARIIGFSIANEEDLHRVAAFVMTVRHVKGSTNGPGIMIGGPVIPALPALASAVGADMVSGDAPDALEQATLWIKGHPIGSR